MSTDLEATVQWLADIERIKQLKLRYARFCDDDYDPEGIASCFTEDGVWNGGDFGTYEGRQAIIDFFSGSHEVVSYAIHYTTNPIIEVDGDTATGTWYLWQPMIMVEGDASVWYMAHYEEEYVRQDGQWLIKHLKLHAKSLSPVNAPFK